MSLASFAGGLVSGVVVVLVLEYLELQSLLAPIRDLIEGLFGFLG